MRSRAIVVEYLRGRGITLELPPSIREGRMLYLDRVPLPSMVVAVQAPNRAVIAVQTTLLTWSAAKAPATRPRTTTGAMGYGAVRLAAAGPVLGLAEGVETALSAMQISGVPVWATLGAQRLGRIALPPCVGELILFADNDKPGCTAAEMAAERYARDGIKIQIRHPAPAFGDWNDALAAQSVSA